MVNTNTYNLVGFLLTTTTMAVVHTQSKFFWLVYVVTFIFWRLPMFWYLFLNLLIILSDGVVAENLLIEPMMNTMLDYLKNVTQGVAMVLTKIDGENRGKI